MDHPRCIVGILRLVEVKLVRAEKDVDAGGDRALLPELLAARAV
jgi:hypothetical protein